jgi:hypothetical protein
VLAHCGGQGAGITVLGLPELGIGIRDKQRQTNTLGVATLGPLCAAPKHIIFRCYIYHKNRKIQEISNLDSD